MRAQPPGENHMGGGSGSSVVIQSEHYACRRPSFMLSFLPAPVLCAIKMGALKKKKKLC